VLKLGRQFCQNNHATILRCILKKEKIMKNENFTIASDAIDAIDNFWGEFDALENQLDQTAYETNRSFILQHVVPVALVKQSILDQRRAESKNPKARLTNDESETLGFKIDGRDKSQWAKDRRKINRLINLLIEDTETINGDWNKSRIIKYLDYRLNNGKKIPQSVPALVNSYDVDESNKAKAEKAEASTSEKSGVSAPSPTLSTTPAPKMVKGIDEKVDEIAENLRANYSDADIEILVTKLALRFKPLIESIQKDRKAKIEKAAEMASDKKASDKKAKAEKAKADAKQSAKQILKHMKKAS
jgi:hypothetical protein